MNFRVHVQVCLCFCLDLPSCLSMCWCQQNTSAPRRRLSPHPSPSSFSFSGPPSSRAEMVFNQGQGTAETLPSMRCSAGSRWLQREPGPTDGPWHKLGEGRRAWRPVPSCMSGGRPLSVALWWFLNRNWGVPRGLAVKPPARAAAGSASRRGDGEGPFPCGIK